ncbi:hypothetical protein [uncultured Erythrobacter sp.]|uniref:hypothetical protein n=1 Tax=uncultured Erythrobacter sp. TaxID=263913 RepID=UPI0026397370|nr:hypothetical protein [uncultured Erythrobacter sp.]
MTVRNKAIIWAAIIISAALIMAGLEMSTGASFGVIGGLTGAALASTQSEGACGRGCLQ